MEVLKMFLSAVRVVVDAMATATGLLGLWAQAVRWFANADATALAAILRLSALTLVMLLLQIWQQARYKRRGRYAEVLPNILESAKVQKKPDLDTPEACVQVMSEIVN